MNIPFTVDVPYKYAAGQYMSRFLIELRDNGRFYGIRCPRCARVQMPPRVVCAVCHVRNREWVEPGYERMLLGFSIVHLPLTDPTTGKPHKTPYTYGSVRLDGSDSALDHLSNIEPDIAKVRVGMRMWVVLRPKEQHIGDPSDILYFEPVEGQEKPAAGTTAR